MKTISFTNSLRVPGGDPKRMLFPKQAYHENDILLVSLEEDTEGVEWQ
ncbi:MAG: hypothetical protein RIB71_22600 [Imperialibacter sp.]